DSGAPQMGRGGRTRPACGAAGEPDDRGAPADGGTPGGSQRGPARAGAAARAAGARGPGARGRPGSARPAGGPGEGRSSSPLNPGGAAHAGTTAETGLGRALIRSGDAARPQVRNPICAPVAVSATPSLRTACEAPLPQVRTRAHCASVAPAAAPRP